MLLDTGAPSTDATPEDLVAATVVDEAVVEEAEPLALPDTREAHLIYFCSTAATACAVLCAVAPLLLSWACSMIGARCHQSVRHECTLAGPCSPGICLNCPLRRLCTILPVSLSYVLHSAAQNTRMRRRQARLAALMQATRRACPLLPAKRSRPPQRGARGRRRARRRAPRPARARRPRRQRRRQPSRAPAGAAMLDLLRNLYITLNVT